jgi:hypothetical protein
MKKLTIAIFCCFFLVSGGILCSIGVESIFGGSEISEAMFEGDESGAFAEKSREGVEPSPEPESNAWSVNPFRNLGLGGEGVPVEGGGEDEDESEMQAGPLSLVCVSIGADQSYAVINGGFYVPGGKVDGFSVRKIAVDGVILEKDGILSKLKLKGLDQ